jgi:hypothetical protein
MNVSPDIYGLINQPYEAAQHEHSDDNGQPIAVLIEIPTSVIAEQESRLENNPKYS